MKKIFLITLFLGSLLSSSLMANLQPTSSEIAPQSNVAKYEAISEELERVNVKLPIKMYKGILLSKIYLAEDVVVNELDVTKDFDFKLKPNVTKLEFVKSFVDNLKKRVCFTQEALLKQGFKVRYDVSIFDKKETTGNISIENCY